MLRLKPNPNPSPEHVKLVSEIGTKFGSPDCSKETSPAFWGGQAGGMTTSKAAGKCQICRSTVSVATRNHGLQCSNRGHWVCWGCRVKGIDWEKAGEGLAG